MGKATIHLPGLGVFGILLWLGGVVHGGWVLAMRGAGAFLGVAKLNVVLLPTREA